MLKSQLIALLESIPGDFDVACYDETDEGGMRPQTVKLVENEDAFPYCKGDVPDRLTYPILLIYGWS